MNWFMAIVLIVIAVGCKTNTPNAPHDTNKRAQKENDKNHIAPPPAYGNKIVKYNSSSPKM